MPPLGDKEQSGSSGSAGSPWPAGSLASQASSGASYEEGRLRLRQELLPAPERLHSERVFTGMQRNILP